MSYIIIGLVVISLVHFIYESTIAPSLRLSIRYELFALRDQLRSLKIEHADQLDDKHFYFLQDSINSIISTLPKIEVVTLARTIKAINNDAELKARLKFREKILDDCAFPELENIRKKSINLSVKALAVNSGMWVPYALPFMLFGNVCRSLKTKIKTLISLPDQDIQKMSLTINTYAQ